MTDTLLVPPLILAPVFGYTRNVLAVLFRIIIRYPATATGNFTPELTGTVVTILILFVINVAFA